MDLSLAEARRIALSAQGFGRVPAKATLAHVRKVADKLLTIQLDSVNVLVRSHYLPAYSRLGPYRRTALDDLTYDRKELFECWSHASCLLPARLFPLMLHRMLAMRTSRTWSSGAPVEGDEHIEAVLHEISERGPLAAADLTDGGTRTGKWWGWSKGKAALEALLECGYLGIAGRRGFTRVYDLIENVIPAEHLNAPVPDREEAQKELLCLSAGALGVATGRQLSEHLGLHSFRIRVRQENGKPSRAIWPALLKEVVAEGRLVPVAVEGWKDPGYVLPGTRVPKPVQLRALLSPFDSFLRVSSAALCGFTNPVGLQLYVPAERRQYGYFVLPFLLGDTLVGRCDLKADRQRGTLMVQSAYVEPGHDPKHVAHELAAELRQMQAWLELEDLEVADRGNLAKQLRRAL
ncbi:winged helix-turn-helix domain-containing protein [Tenggerimyces flavus]|uniref:Winged helix-turn-helix domain-containing protein n=1 Tax=Tenggerimyces flavus TaxID=1708749 RepID=A0ABV7YCB9_9ACTN|nr:crosslink repair DNA glycosylase YcaQ family protein [Tenggerimyces flavus]MBM7788179.1 uncharacterized protein YcaQ [Tenggerimyces flavus]